ncbi:hypothetical protein DRO59_03350 [Candidatus Bathyarchaeota archaeon]|nr:MAG: hypothetical protein DRO59_03350 [Candidatus Bathyarchaeota archaeon]
MKMKYYAINWYKCRVWLESGYYDSNEAAEEALSRNNPQIILTQEEMKKVVESVITDFPDLRSKIG